MFQTESPHPMMEVEDAIAIVLDRAGTMDTGDIEQVPFGTELDGRILAADVLSPTDQPPFRASIMDGYAVASLEPGTYPVAAKITAGHGSRQMLQPGQVTYITTGAPVPDGALAVVKVEETSTEDLGLTPTSVHIQVASSIGKWIREKGSDVQAGNLVLEKGTTLGPAEIALLASVGAISVPLRRRPIIGVMSTGDELVDATKSGTPGDWKIRDTNRPMLLAAARSTGAVALDLGIAPDSEEELRAALEESSMS